jgi:hypothetical protein
MGPVVAPMGPEPMPLYYILGFISLDLYIVLRTKRLLLQKNFIGVEQKPVLE